MVSPAANEGLADESLSADISEDEISAVSRNKRKIRRSYGKQSRSAKSNGIVANTAAEESSSDEEILDIETTEDQSENSMIRCVNDLHCGSVVNVADECVGDAEMDNERAPSEQSDYETSANKNIRLQCDNSVPRDMSAIGGVAIAVATAVGSDDCANNNNENTINNNKKLNHDNSGASNNHIKITVNDDLCGVDSGDAGGRLTNNFVNNSNNDSIKSASETIECEEGAIDVIATDDRETLSLRSSYADDGDASSDVNVVVDTQKQITANKKPSTAIDTVKRSDSLSPSNALRTNAIGHEHIEQVAETDDAAAICMMVNLKKEVSGSSALF